MSVYAIFGFCVAVSIWGMAAANKAVREEGLGTATHIFLVSALYGTTWAPVSYLGEIFAGTSLVIPRVWGGVFLILGFFVVVHTLFVPISIARKVVIFILGMIFVGVVDAVLRSILGPPSAIFN